MAGAIIELAWLDELALDGGMTDEILDSLASLLASRLTLLELLTLLEFLTLLELSKLLELDNGVELLCVGLLLTSALELLLPSTVELTEDEEPTSPPPQAAISAALNIIDVGLVYLPSMDEACIRRASMVFPL